MTTATRGGRRALLQVVVAHGVSRTGDTMTLVAVPWFVLQTTGSASRTGIAAGVSVLAVVVSSVVGGALIDRVGHRRTSVVADLASGSTVALIPLCYASGLLSFPLLLALVFAGALLDAPARTARSALLPDLATRAGTSLERASSSLDAVERAAQLVAAPLAGLLIALLGSTQVLLVDAATFGVSALLVVTAGLGRAPAEQPAGRRYLDDVREGFAYLARDPLLRVLVAMVAVTNMLDLAYVGVLLPVFADTAYGGSTDLGLMIGAFGVGATVSALAYGQYGHRWPRWALFTGAFLLCGGPRWFVLAAEPPLWVVLAVALASGLCAGVLNPLLASVQLRRIPARLRARVLAAVTAGVLAVSPLGPTLGGFLVGGVGPHGAALALGCAYLLATLAPLTGPTWRRLDDPPVEDVPAPGGTTAGAPAAPGGAAPPS